MTEFENLYRALTLAAGSGKLRKFVLSKPEGNAPEKSVGRLVSLRGENAVTFEDTVGNGKVSHKHILLSDFTEEVLEKMMLPYRQANLLTSVGDGEYRRSKGGKEIFLGGVALLKSLAVDYTPFKTEVTLDRQKQYILSGKELFLQKLEISDKNGRVHDKKQAKYRQINRFLEHVEEIYTSLPKDGSLLVYDLCCGKSYLSFAVYYYLTAVKGRSVSMLGMDLKADVMAYCQTVADESGFTGMHFESGDIRKTPRDRHPDLVISLHACDIATDIVLSTAVELDAGVILSTPCCHRYMNDKIRSSDLSFITDEPFLRNKLCEVATDSLRILRLKAAGYRVSALELTDPDDTPKNTLIRAVKRKDYDLFSSEAAEDRARYEKALAYLTGLTEDAYFGGVLK